MDPKQIFMSLTATFMTALAVDHCPRPTRIERALELALGIEFQPGVVGVEVAAFEYARWVINRGKPPEWLPRGFNHGYLG